VENLALAIPIVVVGVFVSAVFSGTELALFSLRRVDRQQMAQSSRPADQRVLGLLAQPRRLITTVLICNETVNGVVAVVALVAIAARWPSLVADPWWLSAITLAVVLPVVVLVAEVLPRTLAQKSPVAWARATASLLAVLRTALSPVRWVIHTISDLLAKPFGVAGRPRQRDLTEEEFRILVDAGSAEGQVDARERRLIHRVFEFSDKNVGQIMTPRDKVFALAYDLPMSRIVQAVAQRGYSRVPIYQKAVDNIRGILNAKDLVRAEPVKTLGEILHEPLFVPRTTPVKRLFLTFKQKKVHMGIVVNEYGKVLGLVTMDDVLAQLFGAIRDERHALQAEGRRGRGGKTPVPTPAPASARPDSEPPTTRGADFAPGAEGMLTPDDLTPPPQAIPLPPIRSTTAPEEAQAPPPSPVPASGPTPPSRAGTVPEAADEPAPPTPFRKAPSKLIDDATPAPITDADTGPSGPVRRERPS
jgi:CBS domain containing-hemolysin-like protein